MKKMLLFGRPDSSVRLLRTVACILVGIGLLLAFLSVTTPAAKAREMSASDMVQAQLPRGQTMKSASKADLGKAVCAAMKKNKSQAAQIVRAVIEARKEIAAEIVGTAARCLGKRDCDAIADMLRQAIAADSDDASAMTEAAMTAAPDCRGALGGAPAGEGNFDNAPANQNPPPGSVGGGGGGFDPQSGTCQVCHQTGNGGSHTLNIPCNAVPAHVRHGDTEGACAVTPTQNQ
jgi:hypothetical protein